MRNINCCECNNHNDSNTTTNNNNNNNNNEYSISNNIRNDNDFYI